MRYRSDLLERTFAPYVVYHQADRSIHVSGYQEENPSKPLDRHEWRDFEMSEVRSVTVTEKPFVPEATFDPFNKRYRAGIICDVRQNLR